MDLFKRMLQVKQDGGDAPAANAAVDPRHVTGGDFETVVLGAQVPAVVDFWAEWCGPCKAIAPAVAKLAAEFDGRAVVAKINADDDPEILMRYGVSGIPTLIYFRGGAEVDRVVGLTRYDTLKSKLERLLA